MIIKLTRCDGVRAIVAHFLSGWPLEPDLSWRHVPERLVVVTWRLNICLQFPEQRIKKIVSLQQHFDSRPISVRHLLSRSEIHLLCLPVSCLRSFGRDRSQIINGKPVDIKISCCETKQLKICKEGQLTSAKLFPRTCRWMPPHLTREQRSFARKTGPTNLLAQFITTNARCTNDAGISLLSSQLSLPWTT